MLVTYWYLPHVGGVNHYINLLKEGLIKAGHQVDILAHHPDMDKIYMLTTGEYVKKEHIKDVVYQKVLNYYNRYQPYVEPWIRWREIERYTFELISTLFRLDQYDLIHAQDIISTRALARVKPKHIPLIASLHGLVAPQHLSTGEITSKKSLPWRYACLEEYYGATSADITIVPSNYLKRQYKRLGIPVDHLLTIPYAVNIDHFLKQSKDTKEAYLPFKGDKTAILCPAPLLPENGHRHLIEALAILKRRGYDQFVCWIVGSGKMDQELIAMTYRFNLEENILFLGERSKTAPLIMESDMIVLPATRDNNPYTIMEAHIAEKLVVATRAGSTPELIEDGVTGLLFPPRNSRQLANTLEDVLLNVKKRKKIAHQGYQQGIKKWDAQQLLNRLMDVYQQTLTQPSLERS